MEVFEKSGRVYIKRVDRWCEDKDNVVSRCFAEKGCRLLKLFAFERAQVRSRFSTNRIKYIESPANLSKVLSVIKFD